MGHDLVIRNGQLIDGTGARGVHGDLAIDGDTITAVGDVDEEIWISAPMAEIQTGADQTGKDHSKGAETIRESMPDLHKPLEDTRPIHYF